MGQTGGFLIHKRTLAKERDVKDRIKDWNEFYISQSIENMKKQAARCMECATPFCHTGKIIGGMASGCPIHNLIPEWNDLIYRGLWKEAYKRLIKTNPFPEFTSRVCPAPCEGSCTAGLNGEPVTIKMNEKEVIEKAFKEGWVKSSLPKKRTNKKVAIIGSGPSGLAGAHILNQKGHKVCVYERADRAGGLLTYGIPNMKLDKKKVVKRRVDLLKEEGVEFILNTKVGVDITIDTLRDKYDALILCAGATKARDLNIKGRESGGIHFAVDYLTQNTKNILDETDYITAKGKNVVVIGGGDTGTDCVATAIRQGCRSVKQLEIMPRLPNERQDNNPWPEWPKVLKTDYGQVEAKEVFRSDPREFQVSTKEFFGDEEGNVKEILVEDIEWKKDEKNRFYPESVEGSKRYLRTQLVLLALGFTGPEDKIFSGVNIRRDKKTNVETIKDSYRTSLRGVFVAGDMRRGQSLVVWAIKEGMEAASEVDEYLNSI